MFFLKIKILKLSGAETLLAECSHAWRDDDVAVRGELYYHGGGGGCGRGEQLYHGGDIGDDKGDYHIGEGEGRDVIDVNDVVDDDYVFG